MCKQMTELMLSQWLRNGHICENFFPSKNATDCSGTKMYHWGVRTHATRQVLRAHSRKPTCHFATLCILTQCMIAYMADGVWLWQCLQPSRCLRCLYVGLVLIGCL